MKDPKEAVGHLVRFTASGVQDYGEQPKDHCLTRQVERVDSACFHVTPGYETRGGNTSCALPFEHVESWDIID